ncbi:MAG: hypothetical protein HDS66_05345 [Bacteroidales bacterium]|nr:hypothetical protein [Bacteroidales bacterium]
MIDNQFTEYKECIAILCNAVEKRLGRSLSSHRDFDYLSEELSKAGKRVSGSTLKRIWGYNKDVSSSYKPYQYTILSLVNFLGYNSLEDFVNCYDSRDIQSAEFIGETITTDEIVPGSVIELSWLPDRVCNLICLSQGVFKVVHSEHGRLYPGDVVKFKSLTQNAPLYFYEVSRPGSNETFIYTAGQRTGIRYHIRGMVSSCEDMIIT